MSSSEEKTCVFCGGGMHPERVYDYCLKEECYRQGFKQTEYVVLGVHKSTPIICSPTDQLVSANRSYMNAK
jgi:hypothetical protein